MPKILEMPPPKQEPVMTAPSVPLMPAMPEKPKKKERPIYYPELIVNGIKIPRSHLRISVDAAKDILGFETEEQYAERMCKHFGTVDKSIYVFRAPDEKNPKNAKAPEYQFKGPSGQKCICWRNANNRPLRESWLEEIAQDILYRKFLFNCETIIISKTRLVESGQHRLLALIWAWMLWSGPRHDYWKQFWPEEPYIESLLACGAEETPEVLMTLDNTLARTDADNYITTDLIDWTKAGPNNTQVPLSSVNKNECAKMLEQAVRFLWNRTGGGGDGEFSRKKTKQVAIEFTKAHATIMKCVRHIWEENSGDGRAISASGLRPGLCAGAMYLMASSKSNGEKYRHKATAMERSEEWLDFSLLDKSKEFFSIIAGSNPDANGPARSKELMAPLWTRLGKTLDPNHGAGGNQDEQAAIVAKAWATWVATGNITDESLVLHYDEVKDTAGNLKGRYLDECPLFGGIDIGRVIKQSTGPMPSPVEIEENEGVAKREKDDEVAERFRQSQMRPVPTQAEKIKQKLAELKSQAPGCMIVIKNDTGSYVTFDTDAMIIGKTLGMEVNDNCDPVRLGITRGDSKDALARIASAHSNVVIATKRVLPGGVPSDEYMVEKLEYTGAMKPDGTPV